MGIKIFGPGGVDQKSSDLVRDPNNLRDARNIQYNIRGEYVKRDGVDTDANFLTEPYNDVIFIKSLGIYFYWDGLDYVTYDGSVRKNPYAYFKGALPNVVNSLSLAEYSNTAIFTHSTNPIAVATYDGHAVYRSGLPTPKTTITSGSGTGGFALTFFEFIDNKGNLYYGPSTINETLPSGSIGISYTSLNGTGFFEAYLKATISTTPIIINSSLRVLTFTTKSPDIVVGAKVVIRNRGTTITIADTALPSRTFGDAFVILEVESIVGFVITFTASSIGTKQIAISLFSGSPVIANIHGSTVIRVLFSTDTDVTGYTTKSTSSENGQLVDNSASLNSGTYTFESNYDVPLSGFYDITTSKLRPPSCKFVQVYGYQIVCGGVTSFWDFQNTENIYSDNDDLIIYSDLSTGDRGVNFSEANRQLIGNTYDGEITGLARSKDSLIAFKDRSIFSLDGLLIPGQYSVRKIETDEIGCLSHKSILSVEGLVIFQGQDGLYAINGYSVSKITTQLDPFFLTVNPVLTRSTVRSSSRQYIFWTDQGTVVLDYDFKQWFIWNNIDSSKGLTVDNSGSVRMFNASSAKKFITAKNDGAGVAINSYIDTAWFDMGEPSVLKKATDMRVFSLNNAGQTLQLNYYFDWDVTKTKGPFQMDFSLAATKTVLRKLDIIQNQSFSFRLSNNIVNEDMNITGFEITSGIIQTKDKNVK